METNRKGVHFMLDKMRKIGLEDILQTVNMEHLPKFYKKRRVKKDGYRIKKAPYNRLKKTARI